VWVLGKIFGILLRSLALREPSKESGESPFVCSIKKPIEQKLLQVSNLSIKRP
jgi:hypothetical protein